MAKRRGPRGYSPPDNRRELQRECQFPPLGSDQLQEGAAIGLPF